MFYFCYYLRMICVLNLKPREYAEVPKTCSNVNALREFLYLQKIKNEKIWNKDMANNGWYTVHIAGQTAYSNYGKLRLCKENLVVGIIQVVSWNGNYNYSSVKTKDVSNLLDGWLLL